MKDAWFELPEEFLKQSVEMPSTDKQALQSVLSFVNQSHEGSLNDLMKHILGAYTRRRSCDFPVPPPTEKMSFVLPETLKARLEEMLAERQHEDPRASMDHLVQHAVASWLNGKTRLVRAWREWEEQAENDKGEADQNGHDEVDQSPRQVEPDRRADSTVSETGSLHEAEERERRRQALIERARAQAQQSQNDAM